MLHGSNEIAKAIVCDQKLLRNPSLMNDLLRQVLILLCSGGDFREKVKCGYDIVHDKQYIQNFAGPIENYMPKFYSDVVLLLCRLCEYQIVTGHNEKDELLDKMLLGCVLLLGGMYSKMCITSTKGETTFRDSIGDPNTAVRCSDIGEKCDNILKMMLHLYVGKREGCKCGSVIIPRRLVYQCSDNVLNDS